VFEEIARRTGDACLDFYGARTNDLRDILEAVAVLAYGGVKLLEEKRGKYPARADCSRLSREKAMRETREVFASVVSYRILSRIFRYALYLSWNPLLRHSHIPSPTTPTI
jgi:hypothetical protein